MKASGTSGLLKGLTNKDKLFKNHLVWTRHQPSTVQTRTGLDLAGSTTNRTRQLPPTNIENVPVHGSCAVRRWCGLQELAEPGYVCSGWLAVGLVLSPEMPSLPEQLLLWGARRALRREVRPCLCPGGDKMVLSQPHYKVACPQDSGRC